jgi:hypothetical protein
MARSKGIVKLQGSLGNLSFYDSVFGPIVRTKGGPSKEKIRSSPKLVRVREQNKEFGEAAKAAKLLRLSLKLKPKGIMTHSVTWRVNQLMNSIKDKDTTSARGKRKVEKGLATTPGKNLMAGFDITEKAALKKILLKPVVVNSTLQTISIKQFVPAKDVRSPKGATHLRITGGYTRIDIGKELFELKESSPVVLNVKSKASSTIVLQMNMAGLTTGYDLYFIFLEFLQEVNSSYYELENKQHNCLSFLKVV